MTIAYLLLGSNIAPEDNLPKAVALLKERIDVRAVSPVYETEPVGYTEQPPFLNAAVAVYVTLRPRELKDQVLGPIEDALGRRRTANKNAPRTIDIDIVLYGSEIVSRKGMTIPAPDLLEYAHVARPVADLAPRMLHPETGEALRDIAARLDSPDVRVREDITLTE